MTQSVIGALRVNLGLDSAQFSKGAKRAETTVQRLGSSLQKFGAAMSVVSAGIAAGLRSQLNAAEQVGRAAKIANTGVVEFQRLAIASRSVGIESDKLSDILKDVSDKVGDFLTTGGGPMADFFEKIAPQVGVTANEFRNLSGAQALQLYVDTLEKANLSQSEMTFFLEAIANDATALIPILANSGAELNRLADASANAGGIIAGETVEAAKRFNDSMRLLGDSIGAVGVQITGALAPAMATIAEAVAGTVAQFTKLSPAMKAALSAVVVLTGAVGPLALAIGTLIKGMIALRAASFALFGPVGLMAAAAAIVGTVAVTAATAAEKTDTLSASMRATVEAAAVLGTELGILSGNDLPTATRETVGLANANLTLARSAFAAAEAELAKAKAVAEGLQQQVAVESAFLPGVEPPSETAYREALEKNRVAAEALRAAQKDLEESVFEGRKVTEEASEETQRLTQEMTRAGGAARSLAKETEETAQGFAPLETAVGSVSDAFGNFIANGLTDFKSFTQTIVDSFKNMLAQMISLAIRNRITIGIGTAATGAGGAANAATGLLSGLGSTGFGGGLSAAFSGGIGNFFNIGGNAAAAGGGLAATLGAAAGPIGLGLGIIGGILGARRRRRQRRAAAAAAEAQRVAQEQAAEEQRQAAIADERVGLETQLLQLQGDTAELRRRELETLDPANRALAERLFNLEDETRIMRERESLEERLLRLQGNTEELRRREIEALDPANRSLLQQIFALEDYKDTLDSLTASLNGAFDLSTLEYGSAFEARLAQVAEARGVDSIAGVAARNLMPSGDPQIELLRKQLTTLEGILQYGIPGRA